LSDNRQPRCCALRTFRLNSLLELLRELLRDDICTFDDLGGDPSKVGNMRAEGGLSDALNEFVEEGELGTMSAGFILTEKGNHTDLMQFIIDLS